MVKKGDRAIGFYNDLEYEGIVEIADHMSLGRSYTILRSTKQQHGQEAGVALWFYPENVRLAEPAEPLPW